MHLSRFGFVALAVCLFTGVANAGNFSFSGVFSQDDQLQVFLFTAPSASTLVRTWGYAGGTNANGQVIAAGGFDPILSVFDATGGLVAGSLFIDSNNDGLGVDTDPVTGNAFDSLLLLPSLSGGGIYALVISQNDNVANGPTYADGFSRTGQGNFTATSNGCGGTAPFCESPFSAYRTGQWAVDIDGVRDAAELGAGTGTPEPASMLLLTSGIAGLALLRRRGKQA
jgi:hypothetical protein